MKTGELHRWDVTYREAAVIQEELRGRLILRDDGLADPLRTVAGADICSDRGNDLFFAAVVLMSYQRSEDEGNVLAQRGGLT